MTDIIDALQQAEEELSHQSLVLYFRARILVNAAHSHLENAINHAKQCYDSLTEDEKAEVNAFHSIDPEIHFTELP